MSSTKQSNARIREALTSSAAAPKGPPIADGVLSIDSSSTVDVDSSSSSSQYLDEDDSDSGAHSVALAWNQR